MRFFGSAIKLVFISIFVLSFCAGSLVVMSLDERANVVEHKQLNIRQIKQVQNFVKKTNPVQFKAGQKKLTVVNENELNLFVSHSLMRINKRLRARVRLFEDNVYINSSIKVPTNPIGKYVNVSIELKKQGDSIVINTLKVGGISVPGFISALVLNIVNDELNTRYIEYRHAKESITSFEFKKGMASIDYVWSKDAEIMLKDRIATSVLSKDLQNKIEIYTRKITAITVPVVEDKASLVTLINPCSNLQRVVIKVMIQ